MAEPTVHSTTQEFLEIFDIINNIAIMKDGAAALVLSVDAMNFGLLAEAEQDAVIYAYAGLLNSLNYPIQIVIRSKTKDVTTYLKRLEDQEKASQDDRKKLWISRYRQFVGNLIKKRNVLDKKFYIVIPATALELGLVSAKSVVPGVKSSAIESFERSVVLEKAQNILEPKRDHLISQFARIGLFARQLNTQEIIQMFYTSYNPEAFEGQQITDTKNYTTPVVQAQTIGDNMNDLPVNQPSVQPTPPNPQPASPQKSVNQAPNPEPQPPVVTPTPPQPVATPPTPPVVNQVVAAPQTPAPVTVSPQQTTPAPPTQTPPSTLTPSNAQAVIDSATTQITTPPVAAPTPTPEDQPTTNNTLPPLPEI